MVDYSFRIPVKDSYTLALGRVVYNFATAGWMLVYLGSLLDSNFVSNSANGDFSRIARDFAELANKSSKADFIDLAGRFTKADTQRTELLRSIPITAEGGMQELDGVQQWSEEDVLALARDAEQIDLDANSLYYKSK